MKRNGFKSICLLASFFALCLGCQSPPRNEGAASLSLAPVDKNSISNAVRLYDYLVSLPQRTTKKYLSCQFFGTEPAYIGFDNNVRALYEETDEWPAMIGVDYIGGRENPDFVDTEGKTNTLAMYWLEGGLTTVTLHVGNPWSGGDALSRSFMGGKYEDSYTPGTKAYGNLKVVFDRIADEFLKLQKIGCVVLFRPFHEMNGQWFWWYTPDPSKFKQLWRYWQNYLTNERGVHNLLYVFSPNAMWDYQRHEDPNYIIHGLPYDYYPGNESVDIVSLDVYYDDPYSMPIENYVDLLKYGKPFAMGELGRDLNNLPNTRQWDQTIQIRALNDKYPKTVFWQSWGSWKPIGNMAIVDLPNAESLMRDPSVITRADVLFEKDASPEESDVAGYPLGPNAVNAIDSQEIFVHTGEAIGRRWKFTEVDPGSRWNEPSFDDSQWKKGMSPFGSPWIKNAFPRTDWRSEDIWLRKVFDNDFSAGGTLVLKVFHDDDAECYLNGILVAALKGYKDEYIEVELSDGIRKLIKSKGNILALHCWNENKWGANVDAGLYIRR
ncbi:MAG: glycosyl hydrolase [Spirochaetes bacterium]|nr:glycosyl hydrolase [Spirochaetota bacterium]